MQVEVVDLEDRSQFHEWYTVVSDVWRAAWPGDPLWAEEEQMRELFLDQVEKRRILLVGRGTSGEVVGAAEVGLPLRENHHVAEVEVSVPPSRQGRGFGRALLEKGEELARASERTVHLSNTYGRSASLASRDARFATSAGFRVARCEVRRELHVPEALARIDEVERSVGPQSRGYRIVSWWNRCPDELVESRARLASTLTADEPRGDLDTEDEKFDVGRVRRWERDIAKTGRDLACTGAVSRVTGELAAVTELGLPRPGEDLALQFATVVAREHRGHRLGILVKLDNLRLASQHNNPPQRIGTWNAEVNDHMIRVNEVLGFRVAGKAFNWQKR